MFKLKLAVLLAAAVSVAAMPSHLARQAHHHREIAARVPQPDVAPVAEIDARNVPAPSKRLLRKRARGRCSPTNPSSSLPSSTPADPQPSPSPLGNERNDPQPSSTPPQDPPSTPTPEQPQPTPDQPTPDPATTPTPTPTPVDTPAASPPPPPASGSDNNNNSGGGAVYTGQATFYATGLGACGIVNNDGQDIAAVSHSFFDSFPGYDGANPNNNPMCGKTARVTFEGKTIFVALTDRCEGCAYGDLDFSPHAFNQLADPSAGRVSGIQWTIVS